MSEPWQDPDRLQKLYVDRRLTTAEVAEELGCSSSCIEKWLDRHGIETRTRGDYAAGRGNSRWREYAPYHRRESGYGVWYSKADDATVLVHRLAAVAWFGYDAVAGNVVHHISERPWDNREENLLPMSDEAHTSYHATRRAEHGR